MKILGSVQETREYIKQIQHKSIGFVPTMGALHKGHISLIEKSRAEDEITLVSVFVNPAQFNSSQDLDRYPRTMQKDIQICEKLGVNAVLVPEIEDIYRRKDEVSLSPPRDLDEVYEGKFRPGHFRGVLQIVLKLFCLTKPKRAYFGKKDAQQLLIIKRMVEDLFLDIEIVACQTQRDFDGLALSSRNIHLNQEERQYALEIPKTLQTIENLFNQGERQSKKLIDLAKKNIQNIQLEYLDIVDFNLKKRKKIIDGETLVLMAARVGETRLLDNLWL